jgi:hypothetical protein
MISINKNLGIFFLISVVFGNAVWAFDSDDVMGDGTGEQFGFVPGQSWHEGDFALPPMPAESDLIAIKIFQMPHYRYYIDGRSLNVGAKDNVARYTVIIEPPGGLMNVFYEGIRCDTKQYTMYASALWGEAFNPLPDNQWKAINDKGVNVYRHDLFEYFLCNNSLIKADKKDIVRALKSPPDNFIEDELE